jgi:hypothetical protein
MKFLFTKFIVITAVLSIIGLPLFSSGLAHGGSNPSSTAELSQRIAGKLNEKIGSVPVYLSLDTIKDSLSGNVPGLSIELFNQLQAALSQKHFTLVQAVEDAEYLLTCQFQVTDKKVDFFFKYYLTNNPGQLNSFSFQMNKSDISEKLFNEDLTIKARKLVAALQNTSALQQIIKPGEFRLFINPIVESKKKYTSQFSENFLLKIKNMLLEWDMVKIVEGRPLPKLMTRGLRMKAKGVTSLGTSDAHLAGTDAVLDGLYFISPEKIIVNLVIRDKSGIVLASVEENIPREMITLSLENPEAEKIAQVSQIAEQNTEMVKISTDRGSGYQTYYRGDTVTIFIQVAKPLYCYVYSINSKNEVELIHPFSPGDERLFEPGTLYTIPPHDSEWEIAVSAPYGLDNVKVFASNKRLPVPRLDHRVKKQDVGARTLKKIKKVREQLSRVSEINPVDLVDYFKGQVKRYNAELFEDSIFIRTRNNVR